MERTMIEMLAGRVGEEVKVCGWVTVRRDHGKLIFLDLRDATGTVQGVVLPSQPDAHAVANTLRSEWVVEVIGTVNKRPEKMVNKDVLNGDIELAITDIKVLNPAETPPFDLASDGREIGEESRLKYSYLDLRRPRLQRNIRMRDR